METIDRAATPKILIVDDDPSLREALRLFFAEEGYRPICASDGRVALERLKQEQPDLILSDVFMPRLDGPGLLRELRQRGVGVPVVFMSAASEPIAADAPFLRKPLDFDALLDLVATYGADAGRPAD